MSRAEVIESNPRAKGAGFFVVGLMFSLALHAGLLSYFFYPLRGVSVREAHQEVAPLTVSDRLAAADSAILEGSAVLLERVKRKQQEMFAIIKETPEPQWTLAGMPRMYVRAAERVKIDLKSTAVVPANGQKEVYSVTMEVETTPDQVFEDLLTLAHWVGIGTARSNFASESLLVNIREKNRGPAGRFVIPTRDCRLLSAGKLSPENFIARGHIEETG